MEQVQNLQKFVEQIQNLQNFEIKDHFLDWIELTEMFLKTFDLLVKSGELLHREKYAEELKRAHEMQNALKAALRQAKHTAGQLEIESYSSCDEKTDNEIVKKFINKILQKLDHPQ